jgi:hypothetical protein
MEELGFDQTGMAGIEEVGFGLTVMARAWNEGSLFWPVWNSLE